MVHYFTSITPNYLAKARVLCKTLKQHNPACRFFLGLTGDVPEGVNPAAEPFDAILLTSELDLIPQKEIFFFNHTITEICTAVKPALALTLMQKYQAQKVVYLDPDIMVFSDLRELETLLDAHSMIFTPHQTNFEDDDTYVVSNEILFLKRGTYNLGFFAVKADETGLRFLNWWHKRVMRYCFDDDYELIKILEPVGLLGLFTDQKWIDLVPAFFDGYHILKNPGYNVSTWNMTRRVIKRISGERYTINGQPLKFFHFSGFDTKGHHNEMRRALAYNSENVDATQLSALYEAELEKNGQALVEKIPHKYMRYSNGQLIKTAERKILHMRKDVWEHFADPFEVNNGFCYYNWVRAEYGRVLKQSNERYTRKMLLNALFPPDTMRRKALRLVKHKFYSFLSIIATLTTRKDYRLPK
jgi:hypothetical protein